MEYLYHATPSENTQKILIEGLIPGSTGVTYLAETEEDALKFMAFRIESLSMTVFKIDVYKLEQDSIEESFDHSEKFFGCKAWMYGKVIPESAIDDYSRYERVKK